MQMSRKGKAWKTPDKGEEKMSNLSGKKIEVDDEVMDIVGIWEMSLQNTFWEKHKFVKSLEFGNPCKALLDYGLSCHFIKGPLINRGLSEGKTPAVGYV